MAKYSNTLRLFFQVAEGSELDMNLIRKVLFTLRAGSRELIREYLTENPSIADPSDDVTYIPEDDNNPEGFLLHFTHGEMTHFREGSDVEFDVKFIYYTGDVVSSDIKSFDVDEVVNKYVYEEGD